jgi:hypothetical protein
VSPGKIQLKIPAFPRSFSPIRRGAPFGAAGVHRNRGMGASIPIIGSGIYRINMKMVFVLILYACGFPVSCQFSMKKSFELVLNEQLAWIMSDFVRDFDLPLIR